MYIRDWMTKEVVAVAPEEGLPLAIRLMSENRIRHLPVVENGRLIGILSDRNIREYMPSEATSLDIFEIHYLLAKVKVRKIMHTPVLSITPDTPVEEAALLLHDHLISCLPVVENDQLVGIVTDKDMYTALISITGVKLGGHRLCLALADAPGSIREAADLIRAHGFGVESILSSHVLTPAERRLVVIRTRGQGDLTAMSRDLQTRYPDADIRPGHP